jgi:hypothetical protein
MKPSKKNNTGQPEAPMQHKTKKVISTLYPRSGGFYEITRGGQVPPAESNEIQVCAKIFLPKEEDSSIDGSLVTQLRFKRKLSIVGEPLDQNWGSTSESAKGYRRRTEEFQSNKWKKAFAEAIEYCHCELMKLEKALEEREKALIDAEF